MPLSEPVGPRGVAETAANAFSRPSPKTLLSAGVPPQVTASTSTAVWSRSTSVCATSPWMAGDADHIRATVAAVCGEAMDVPDFEP